jgi:peptidoglycan DL-endopeptidase CwlO
LTRGTTTRASSMLPSSILPSSGPTSSESRSPRLRRPALKAFSAAVAALVATALLPAISSQAAQPKTVAEAQARVDQLNEQAEVITEQYNGAQARLAQAQKRAAAAMATVTKAQAQVAAARAKVSAFAAQTYESGGMTETLSVVLATGDPGEALAKMATLQQVGRSQSATLTEARVAAQHYQQVRSAAAQANATAKTLRTQLANQKHQIDNLLSHGRQVLANLTAQQRAQLLALQRAKAAAEQARAATALAAARGAQSPSRASRDLSRADDPAPAATAAPQTSAGSSVAQRALAAAMTRLGRPYVYGAGGPNTFDCSGLVQWAYGQVGVSTAHYTGAFWNAYRHVSQSQLQPGDLVFFYPDHHHVGIYVGGGMMINAPRTGDVVKIASVAGHGNYSGAVRVVG